MPNLGPKNVLFFNIDLAQALKNFHRCVSRQNDCAISATQIIGVLSNEKAHFLRHERPDVAIGETAYLKFLSDELKVKDIGKRLYVAKNVEYVFTDGERHDNVDFTETLYGLLKPNQACLVCNTQHIFAVVCGPDGTLYLFDPQVASHLIRFNYPLYFKTLLQYKQLFFICVDDIKKE